MSLPSTKSGRGYYLRTPEHKAQDIANEITILKI